MSNWEILKSEIKELKARKIDEVAETTNPYLHEYFKGFVIALSNVEGMIAELEEPDILICPKCGLEVHRDFRNCPRCGAKVEDVN